MSAQVLETVKNELLQKRHNLVERIEKIGKNKTQANGPLNADSEEQAVELQGHEVIDALDEIEANELKQIDRALESIDKGVYGQCSSCSDQISEARLKAVPYTTVCISCATDL